MKRQCTSCEEDYEPTIKGQKLCPDCKADRIRDNSNSYQCPYWYCLETYIPGNKPHQHRSVRLTREQSNRLLEDMPDPAGMIRRKR